ncbi:MAG: dihydrofolate reductase [Firmicutes bacterium]|nr:dihydrofolate reductase [Bacillota bacterium]
MTLVAAADRNWGIGCQGAALFRLRADLRRFRELTMGGALLMGRTTYDSLPGILPGRAHVVLSRDEGFAPSGVTVLRGLEEARCYARGRETFLIGGGEVYAALLDDCERAVITRAEDMREADTFMPDLDNMPGWRLTDTGPWQEEDGIRFRVCTYENDACEKSGCISGAGGV